MRAEAESHAGSYSCQCKNHPGGTGFEGTMESWRAAEFWLSVIGMKTL